MPSVQKICTISELIYRGDLQPHRLAKIIIDLDMNLKILSCVYKQIYLKKYGSVDNFIYSPVPNKMKMGVGLGAIKNPRPTGSVQDKLLCGIICLAPASNFNP